MKVKRKDLLVKVMLLNGFYRNIVSRAYLLGFLYRDTEPFKNSISLKYLYTPMIRSILYFGSVVWSQFKRD